MEEFEFKTHNDKEIESNGTCLQGYVNCSYSTLLSLFGEPTDGDEYKTDAEWEIEFSDGLVATIYNWKDGPNYCGEEGTPVYDITDWHIGGSHSYVVSIINTIVKRKESE